MLQWDWPQVWTVENREVVRVAMQSALRKAMSGASQNAQIRGTVSVDLPHLGSSPPEVVLSGIRELTLEHTALMVKVRYDGDFSVTLRGLEINLDTIGSSGGADEVDGNYAMPFYCPLDLTLHDMFVDGMASIEVFQEFEQVPSRGCEDANRRAPRAADDSASTSRARSGTVSLNGPTPRRQQPPLNSISLSTFSRDPAPLPSSQADADGARGGFPSRSPSRATANGRASGYGILLGAGGRRSMRPPPTVIEDRTQARRPTLASSQEPSKNTRPTSADTDGSHGRRDPPPRSSLADIQSHKVRVSRRLLKIQLFGDPVKSFSVQTNFASVPGANQKVEGTIKMLLKPTIDRLMTEGITVPLP